MKTIPILKLNAIQKLIDTEVIKGGMIPKVQSAKKAVLAGVGEVNILNGLYGVSLARGTAIKR